MNTFFRICAVFAVGAALFHAAAMASPAIAQIEYAPTYPVWRHVLFIGIDLACAWLFLKRPPWFVWAYAALTLQILNGHGRGAWRMWTDAGRLDWISIGISLAAPPVLVLLVIDWRARRRRA